MNGRKPRRPDGAAGALLSRWRADYDFKTFVSASGSMLVTGVFALYNGFLGLRHASPWHGSICVYYLLLLLLRAVILQTEKRAAAMADGEPLRRRAHMKASLLLLALNLCLIGPFYLMADQKKPVSLTMIPAIAMAAYTTYKVTMAAVNLKRKNRSENRLVRLLRTINFIDALLSIVTLQNTLIMVNNPNGAGDMLPLVAASSGLIWAAMLAITLAGILREAREKNG